VKGGTVRHKAMQLLPNTRWKAAHHGEVHICSLQIRSFGNLHELKIRRSGHRSRIEKKKRVCFWKVWTFPNRHLPFFRSDGESGGEVSSRFTDSPVRFLRLGI